MRFGGILGTVDTEPRGAGPKSRRPNAQGGPYVKILGMGIPELVIILAVILLIFGPKNLPKLGASIGKTVKSLREGLGGDEKAEAAELIVEDDLEAEAAEPAPKKTASKKARQTA